VRAEPVVGLYEQWRMHHVGAFPKLEDQQTTWTEDAGYSPDRMDALVWAATDLMLTSVGGFAGAA
jgi:phage terminase large subunit-like protein